MERMHSPSDSSSSTPTTHHHHHHHHHHHNHPPPTQSPPSASVQPEYARFRACDVCRRRKIKCDGRISGCRHCVNAGVACVYNTPTKTARRRASSSSQSSRHLPDAETAINLEERLERIERAVKEHLASRLSSLEPSSAPPPQSSSSHPVPISAPTTGSTNLANQKPYSTTTTTTTTTNTNTNPLKQTALYHWKVSDEDQVSADAGLIEDLSGKLKFIGESSVFSLFLPRGMQWVCEKLGEPQLCLPLGRSAINEWSLNSGAQAEMGEGEGEESLPEGERLWELVNEYFTHINPVLPIFSRPAFTATLHNYLSTRHATPSFLISLHTILAISLIANPVHEPLPTRLAAERTAAALFRIAHKHVPTVLFCNRDLSGVQALLVTLIYLWETQSTEGVFTLLGVAVSIGTEIGFHRCGTILGLGLSADEVQTRRNVFWAAYALDKDVSLRIGRSSSITDEDVNVRLPGEGEKEVGIEDAFWHRVMLARLQSRITSLLCSHVGVQMRAGAVLRTIEMLNEELEAWRRGCVLMEGGVEEVVGAGGPWRLQHVLRLRLVYYGCLSAINRPLCPAFDLQETTIPDTTPPSPTSAAYALTLHAARSSIALISTFEAHNLRLYRSSAIYLVAAAVTLFMNTLEDPGADTVNLDVGRIRAVAELLRANVEKGCMGVREMCYLAWALAGMAEESVMRVGFGIGTNVGGERRMEVGTGMGGRGVGRLCRGL